jgi:hypothetical protein
MSALGHKQPFSDILAQCLLAGVKQPFIPDWNGEQNRSPVECLLSSKAAVQIAENRVDRRAAFGQKRSFSETSYCLLAGWSDRRLT